MRPTTTSPGLQPTLDSERTYEPPALIEIGGVYELTLWGGGGGGDDDDDGGGHHGGIGNICWPYINKKLSGSDGFSFGPITMGSC